MISRLSLCFATLLGPLALSAQPNPQGISVEEALAQANELLRQHGIDPTGSDHHHTESDTVQSSSKAPAIVAPGATEGPFFEPLDLEAIKADPDIWPATVVILDTVEFNNGLRLTKGNQADFAGWHDLENIYLDYDQHSLTLPVGLTDLEERANKVARGIAKEEGFQGRLLEQLDGRIVVLSDQEMQYSSAEVLEDADLYLLYMSSEACGWCRMFTPELTKALAKIEKDYPGRVRLIHASVDRNMGEFKTKYEKLEPAAAIPPGDRWYINAYSALHEDVRQIAQPSLMIMNVNGRLIDSSARDGRSLAGVEGVLDRLPGHIEALEKNTPAWTRLDEPLPLESETTAPTVIEPIDFIANNDPSIAGPLPYPATLSDGTAVPGLVIHDTKTTGSRIPAITLQKFPAEDGIGNYYHLAFREVLGETFGSSRPLLSTFAESKTVSGPSAMADLQAGAEAYKGLLAKFEQWKETAIENNVTEFSKPIANLAQSSYRHAHGGLRGNIDVVDDELEVIFMVQNDPQFAFLKTGNVTWNRSVMDAFTRLVPQLDALLSQLQAEEVRLIEDRRQKVKEAQDIDALFQ